MVLIAKCIAIGYHSMIQMCYCMKICELQGCAESGVSLSSCHSLFLLCVLRVLCGERFKVIYR